MEISPINSNMKVAKLFEINKLLTKSFELNIVLKTLVEAAEDLIEVSDTVILYLFDQDENVLKVAEGVGINLKAIENIALLPGESITGKTFSDKKSYLFAHDEEIRKNMANMSERNYSYYYQGVYERQVRSAFCVPLLYQEKCLGVLVVDNFENEGYFTEDDMNVIEIIADQSAIAIVNSDLFQNLKEKNEQLKHSLDIHKKFTKVILEGGGTETILSLLSRILKTKAKFKEIKDNERELHFFPIIRGNEALGYIELDKVVHSLSPLEMVAVEHAATALALELVKQNALYEKELHFRKEIFQQILDGVSSGELKQLTKYFSWNPKWELVCMVMEGKRSPLWKAEGIMDKERFVKSIEMNIRSVCEFSIVFTKAFQMVIIIPVIKKDAVEKIAEVIEGRWREKKEIIYGIGRKVSINNLGSSYHEALDAVQYGKTAKNDKFINYSKLGVERLWQKVDQTTLDYFVFDKIGPLISMGDEYFGTIINLIECNKNHKLTAERLHIHPNTLYQRLKKIERTLNISLDHERDWLNIVSAYRINVSRHNS